MKQMLPRKKEKKRIGREGICGLCFASLPLIGVVLFGLLPILLSFVISFTELRSYRLEQMTFLGMKNLFSNYAYVLKDPLFWKCVKNTLIYSIALPLSIAVSLVVSVLIDRLSVGKKLYRMIFFIPYVCSIVALSQVWRVLLNYDYGVVNDAVYAMFGFRIDWLGTPAGFMSAMIIMSVWQSLGYQVILITAGLGSINKTYYEAASIDGAGRVRQFFSITLPQLSPVLFFLFVTGLIGSLQEFSRMQSINFGGWGPDDCALTMVYYVYNLGFNYTYSYGMGYATAASWIIGVMILAVTIVNFIFTQRLVNYD